MARFGVYVRVSEVGEREGVSFGSPDEQEAAAREWAERAGEEIVDADVIHELDVSGARAADDRELGRLIQACEAGDLDGIIVRYEDRFARDVIEGATALKRISDAGARLIATASGFDSKNLTPDKRAWFTITMAFGQAQREKNREARVRGAQRSAERGNYLASRPPLGYVWEDREKDGKGVGRIVPGPEAPLVQEVFKRRAEGESLRGLAAWLGEHGVKITKSGVRVLLTNRAYLGESTMPTHRRGEVKVIPNAHKPLITPDEFERALAAGGTYQPRNGRWASQASLGGLAVCSGCGKKLSPGAGGKKKDVPYYSCTAEGCQARVGIGMERLDQHVDGLLSTAFLRRVPEVVAIMEGDDRYARALEAVEAERLELETYIKEVRVTDLGREAWVKGKEARQAALDLARRALREVPAPKAQRRGGSRKAMTFEEALPGLTREHNARFIARVVVKPVGRGRRVPAAERADVYLVGAEEPYVPDPIEADPAVAAALAAAAS